MLFRSTWASVGEGAISLVRCGLRDSKEADVVSFDQGCRAARRALPGPSPTAQVRESGGRLSPMCLLGGIRAYGPFAFRLEGLICGWLASIASD